jgi:hypothetical protein
MSTPEKQTPDLCKAPPAPNMDKVELEFAVNVTLRNSLLKREIQTLNPTKMLPSLNPLPLEPNPSGSATFLKNASNCHNSI